MAFVSLSGLFEKLRIYAALFLACVLFVILMRIVMPLPLSSHARTHTRARKKTEMNTIPLCMVCRYDFQNFCSDPSPNASFLHLPRLQYRCGQAPPTPTTQSDELDQFHAAGLFVRTREKMNL